MRPLKIVRGVVVAPPTPKTRHMAKFAYSLAILGLILSACVTGSKSGQQLPGLPNFGWVVENKLARSGQPTDWQKVKELGFISIVSLRDNWNEMVEVRAAGMLPYSFPMSEKKMPSLFELETIVAAINQKTFPPVLVHCVRGSDRTGLTILLYRLTEQGWPYDKAWAEMISYIPEGREVWPDVNRLLGEIKRKYGK
jgi:protein tyrosine/serine phosphatase